MSKSTMSRLALAAVFLAGAASAQTAGAPIVKDVWIKGLVRVSEQLVRSQLEVQTGQAYNPSAVARDIRRLYELGHFDSVKVDAVPVEGGLALTYVFQEKRIIGEIKIIGNNKMRASRIRGVLSWKEGDSFAPDLYDEERQAILKLYQERGFANTTVDINVEELGASRVRIIYSLNEGKKARIRSIDFEGNQALTDRKLRKVMKTRPAFWFLGGKYDEDKLEADLDSVVNIYGDHGYLEAIVEGTDVNYADNGKRMDITIRLAEGAQYSVATLDVANNTVFDDDEVLKIAKVHAGDIHNKSQVTEDANLVKKGYEDSGYVNADVTPQVTLDRDAKTTHIVHNVTEKDLKYIRQIDITGNTVTKDEIIRREVMVAPGDRFDGSAVQFSQRRLENTQYFDAVRLTLRDLPDTELYSDLLLDVDEGKTGNFSFGAGYSTEERLGGFAELRLNNFDITNWPKFSGGGQIFSARLHIGDVRSQYNLSFTDPEFAGYPVAFGFDVFDQSYEYQDNADYTEDIRGGQIRFGKTLSPFVSARTSIRYVDVSYEDIEWRWLYTPIWRRELRSTNTLSNTWGIERNTLDYVRDPTSGGKHALEATVAGFGADNEFIKLEHDSTWYIPLDEARKWILSLRTREGWVNEYGSSDFVPISERFFAGGTGTVRGYDFRDIGPQARKYWFSCEKDRIGGELRLVSNFEVKYKVTKMFRLYAFVDAGGVWWEASDFDFGDMRYSTGLGFGVDVPKLGPFRVDYGVPLNPDDDQGNGRLHLMTGFRF